MSILIAPTLVLVWAVVLLALIAPVVAGIHHRSMKVAWSWFATIVAFAVWVINHLR